MLKWMVKSKNRYFYIFVSPGDASGAITLNVVWMESEFDAYKLSRCMCPSIYYRFWDTARYLWKSRYFLITPLHSTPPLAGPRRNIAIPFGVEKLEWWGYPMVKKNWYMYNSLDSIPAFDRQTDRQKDGQTSWHGIVRAMHTRRAVKINRAINAIKETSASARRISRHTPSLSPGVLSTGRYRGQNISATSVSTISNCVFNFNILALVVSEILWGSQIYVRRHCTSCTPLAENFLYPRLVLYYV